MHIDGDDVCRVVVVVVVVVVGVQENVAFHVRGPANAGVGRGWFILSIRTFLIGRNALPKHAVGVTAKW